ncbi:MAG TPA: sensor histidine kinase [Candidatus Mediterraneibacter cottocaccae]|nr:sensor histidine kinase [Candidatus Mediterraneibacter cottocaccae]
MPMENISDRDQGGQILVNSILRKIGDFNDPVGFQQISIRNSTIVDLVMDGEFVESGTVFLYDSKYNEVIGSTDETRTEKLVAELEMEHADYAEYREWENVNLFGGVHKVRMQKIVNTDWILVSEYPSSYLWGLILEQYAVWLLAAALIGTLAAVFAVLFSRNLTGRIRLLDSHMTELAEGNGTYITESPGKDEIGSLIQNYNVTLKKLKQYMAKIIEDAKSLRVSELKLLQSQINPHFLYNTLDLIRWEALDHDAYRIADIVQALARFYKLSLNQGRETVPIEDEISHVESYVELQNYRYGGTISLEVQIPPELLEFTIVKITLQPLVENAIQHGLTDRKKTGEIVIDGWKEEGYIYLQVTDNGAGMSAEQVEHILKRKSSNDMHGFGIWNINERLRLQYGGKSGLYYESGEGTGTTVTVIIRAEK